MIALKINNFIIFNYVLLVLTILYFTAAPEALGIGAASFASGASKDIAESPTAELKAEPERPIRSQQDYKTTGQQV